MTDLARARRHKRKTLPLVVVLVAPDEDRSALTRLMRGFAEIAFCSTAADAERVVTERRANALLARMRDAEGSSIRDLITRLHIGQPDLAIVILASAHDRGRGQPRAERWPGVAGVVQDDDADVDRQVDWHITRVEHRIRRRTIGSEIARDVPASAQDVVRRAVEDGDRPRSVRDLADALGVPRKTMDRRLSKAIPLTARQLIGWGRLIAVAMIIEETSASVDSVAHQLGFSSPSALRNLLQRYAGLTPTQLRERGGSAHLVLCLANGLRPATLQDQTHR